ncbi:MAG: helix-turn-helix transcriptional regulator [Mesorhizobium sp.]|uniref:XRE family transcriptional regulator n=1 Tax=Mesorhizobium sp. TaxID=1871066 RepID=UPI001227E72E|nr:S24 family peptidase [Mesorhizobium sp.]TIR23984.1 MAG: helix-turn-helix transcriptional regulator [Mesorhizobium sp.]
MEYDDRPDPAKRLEIARKKRGFKTARDAANFYGWSIDSYAQHENGTRGLVRAAARYAKAFGVSEAWLLTGEGEPEAMTIPVVGYLGAGAEIEPDFEQVPPEGLYQIELPLAVPADMIAFEVRGESMLPVFKPGQVVVVWKEQRKPLEDFYGSEAAVRTSDGRRFIKTIMRAGSGLVNLLSWNAAPIENVHLEWIGEIFATLSPAAVRQAPRRGIQGQLRLRA